VAIYTLEDLKARVAQVDQLADRGLKERDLELLHKVAESGPWRKASVTGKSLKALADLADEMPHFAGLIETVCNQLLLAQATRRPPRLRPMLLVGPPGLGKSYFAEHFAMALGVPIHRLAMDTVQTSSALSGSDAHWSNSHIGVVFQALALGPVANPVIVLDEIDKACQRGGQDPLAPLHGLLEPLTAQHFSDRSLSLPLDARHVVWIATANALDSLDAPLRSRFEVHTIPAPDAQQALRLARAIALGLLKAFGLRLDIPEAALERLTPFSPREQRQALESAIARTVAQGRTVMAMDDLPRPVATQRRRMGFVWSD
jgi:ATP-dependent Lon protease